VAIIGVAISARPVDVTASLAGPAGASTLSAAEQSSLYMQDLLQKAQVRTTAPVKAPNLIMEDLLQKSHPVAPALDLSKVKGINLNDASIVVPLVTSSDQANAYIDSLIARGAAVQADAAAQDLSKVTGINLNDATAVAPLATANDQASAYMAFLLQRHADYVGQLKADAYTQYLLQRHADYVGQLKSGAPVGLRFGGPDRN
jgi:hypothetical protein